MFTEENLPGRLDLSGAMMSYWARFARTGSPGRGANEDESEWSAYDANEQVMLLDTRADGGRRMAPVDPLTRPALLEAIRADSRLDAGDRRCQVYQRMVRQNRLMQSAGLAGLGCP
jgi:hypothetical protein